ncbi:MAG: hypothetical protein QM570_01930 [Planctomycetota bacterium]|nr:hypothetical protein [Planctomycetota bacterium]
MIEIPEKCLFCGAKRTGMGNEYECGSVHDGHKVIYRNYRCFNAENVKLQAENETLRAAIATPEVYAGVVTKVLEAERDAALAELAEMKAKSAEALAVLMNTEAELSKLVRLLPWTPRGL